MNKQTQEIAVMPTEEVAKSLQEVVLSVTGTEGLQGFQRAYMMAEGIKKLKELLTPEFMAPIMELQGSKLGFRTDKDDKTEKYSMDVVKNCIIEAVFNGLQVTGNQFNIIAGNMYPTKEGTGYILNNFKGLKYQIVCVIAQLAADNKSASVNASIKWSLKGEEFEQIVPIPIKAVYSMSVDAIIGKSTRKARAWLISRITGNEVTDGDVDDQSRTATIINVNTKENKQTDEEVETQRWYALFKESTTPEELAFFAQDIPPTIKEAYDNRMKELVAEKEKKNSSKK